MHLTRWYRILGCLGICLLWKGAQTENDEQCNVGPDCPENSVCNETQGSAMCICKPGFNGINGTTQFKPKFSICDDINECFGNEASKCGRNTICANSVGSYNCSCAAGYETQSGNLVFKYPTNESCVDIDECKKNSAVCGSSGECINTEGSYKCQCHSGFENSKGDPKTICLEIDWCKKNATVCGSSGKCIKTRGGHMCKCHSGFGKISTDPKMKCIDINECTKHGCGPNTDCTNTPGSYNCRCNERSVPSTGSQTWTNKTTCLALNCRSPTSTQKRTPCPQSNALSCAINDIIASAEPTCGPFMDQQAQSRKMLQTLLTASVQLLREPEWRNADQLNIIERLQLATEMLHRMEDTLRNLALLLPENETTIVQNGAYIQIWKSSTRAEDISIRGKSTQMQLSRRTALGKRDEGFAVAGLFSFKNMTTILSEGASIETENENEKQPQEYRVISDVVTAFVSNEQPYNLSTPVKFTFSLREKNIQKENVVCCYRKIIGNTSTWSTEGCKTTDISADSVTCECNHLSSFAILMAQYEVESWNLTVITYVGLGVSLVCLLLSIVTFMFCRSLQGTRNTIHLYLCISLFLAYAIFLAGITRVDNEVVCGIIAGLLHYFFLAAFFWMCLEGVELYLMVVKVFKTNAMKKRYMILAGYGLPLVIVGISAAVWSGGYGTKKYCWLSLERGFIWSFMGPVCIIILLNAAIFVITVWKLAQKFSAINPDISELKKFRTFTITAIAQLCLLGCTWIVGVFQFNHNTIAMSYIFTILNCVQGTFIFILHCLMKKQVRDEYRRWLCAAVNLKTPSTYDKFSSSGAFSSSSSQARVPLRPTKESGL